MSAMHEEVVANWQRWIAANTREGLVLVGFEHHCGGWTVVHDWDEWIDNFASCGGCRFSLDGRDAETSAVPLYREASVDAMKVG